MKKIFLSMLAVAGMMFVNSCSQDEIINEPINDGFVNATFTIGATDGMGTRAIGDGTSANVVECAVFDENGAEMTELRQTVNVNAKTATYNVRLAKGQAYRVAFFAYNNLANAYDVTDMKNIQILPNQASNIEVRDAFTNYIDIDAAETINTIEKNVTLYRPFAQLNLGIDDTELADARKAGIVVTDTKVIVNGVYNTFSAFENTVARGANLGSMEFALNGIPTEKLTVNGEEYNYLALNYLLVGDKGTEKSLTDIEFVWETADGKTNNPTTHFINIPVQRNYRTNILGHLLTNPATFNITIDQNFDGEYNENFENIFTTTKTVTTVDELVAAVNNAPEGQTIIKVDADLTSTTPIELDQQPKAQIFIDGQDHKFDLKIIIDGNNNWTGTEQMTIQNVNFNYTGSHDEILAIATDDASTPNSYSHNINISHCTFKGASVCTAIRANQAYDINIEYCEAIGLHSFSQISSSVGVTINHVISNCVRGIHVDARNAVVSNSAVNTADDKYGIRHEIGNANDVLKIQSCNIYAGYPVVVRNNDGFAVASYTLTFEGTNNIENKAGGYHVAIAQEEYDAVGETLTPLAGTVTVNGADSAWSIFK